MLDAAGELDVEDVAVGVDRDLHRVLGVSSSVTLSNDASVGSPSRSAPAVAGRFAGSPLDRAEDVREVGRLGPVAALVAERGVEVAPAVVVRAPGDRVVVVDAVAAVLLDVGALVELEQDVHVLRGSAVKLYHSSSRPSSPGRRRWRGACRRCVDRRGLELERAVRVVVEPRAAVHVALPGPVAVGVGVGVDRDDAAAALRPALEGGALRGVEDALAVVVEEDDDLVRAQAGVGELRRVLAELDVVVAVLAHLRERGLAGVDRVGVAEARGAREDERVEARLTGFVDGDRAGHRRVELAVERVGAGRVERVRDGLAAGVARLVDVPVAAGRGDRVRRSRLVELPANCVAGRDGHGIWLERLDGRVDRIDRRRGLGRRRTCERSHERNDDQQPPAQRTHLSPSPRLP